MARLRQPARFFFGQIHVSFRRPSVCARSANCSDRHPDWVSRSFKPSRVFGRTYEWLPIPRLIPPVRSHRRRRFASALLAARTDMRRFYAANVAKTRSDRVTPTRASIMNRQTFCHIPTAAFVQTAPMRPSQLSVGDFLHSPAVSTHCELARSGKPRSTFAADRASHTGLIIATNPVFFPGQDGEPAWISQRWDGPHRG